MIPEWMLLMDMTREQREEYRRNTEAMHRFERIRQPSDHRRRQ